MTESKRKGAKSAGKVAARRIALLICNGKFLDDPGLDLIGPAKDAVSMESVLADSDICGFEVSTLVDGRLLDIRRGIAKACAEAVAGDTLLLYISGRGFRGEDGCFYFLVHDSELRFYAATALDADFILSQLRRSACCRIVLLIDGCHAGTFFNNNRGIPDGLYAITACGADETCADTPDGGAFTLALVDGMRGGKADQDGDGLVSVDELHQFAKETLKTGGFAGTPQKWVWNVPEPVHIGNVPKHVFLSYAREDGAMADKLEKALVREGLSVWIDREDIHYGSWKERVTEGLNNARSLVFLLTTSSLRSDAVRKELAFAAKKGVPIIPVQPRIIKDGELPDWFTLDYDELQRHFIGQKSFAKGVSSIVRAISASRPQKLNPS